MLALTRSTHATPMFTLTVFASRPEISALDRAGPLKMQTHRKCPPRRLSPLEWIVTRHRRAAASPLESALTRLLALNSFRFRTYIKHPGAGPSFASSHMTHRPRSGLSGKDNVPTARMNNFYQQFAATAERFAARPAIEVQRRDSLDRFTYAELRSMVERAADFLAGRGIVAGDRCAILADNDARWCAAYLGVLRIGGVAVPLDTAYKPQQIAALLRDCGARILFTSPRYLPGALEAGKLANFDDILAQPVPDSGTLPAASSNASAPTPGPATPEDPAVILYTSGTTSDPKGVVLTHANLLAEMEAVFKVVRVDDRDTNLGVLPLFHALAQMANLLLPFSIGAKVVFLEALNTDELLRALRDRGVTAFCCVPQFFYLIHQRVTQQVAAAGRARRFAFRALLRLNGWLRETAGINLGPVVFRRVHDVLGREMRLLVTGGSRFDPVIHCDLYRLGFSLLQAYGLTESSGAASVTRPGDKLTDSVGPPLPGIEVKIVPGESGAAESAAAASAEAPDRK